MAPMEDTLTRAAAEWAAERVERFAPDEVEGLNALPDSYEWKFWLQVALTAPALNERLGLPTLPGVLFTGSAGNGKHTTGLRLCFELVQRGYQMSYLLGEELNDPQEDVVALRLDTLLALCADAPLCLMLENLKGSRYASLICHKLSDAMDEYEDRLFPVLVEEDGTRIPMWLRRRLMRCDFPCPDEAARLTYLQTQTQAGGGEDAPDFPVVLEGMTLTELAAETEGFSYQKLSELLYFARMLEKALAAAQNASLEDVRRLLARGYYPVKRAELERLLRVLRQGPGGTLPAFAGEGIRRVAAVRDVGMEPVSVGNTTGDSHRTVRPRDANREIKKMMDGETAMDHYKLLTYIGFGQ